MGKRITLVDDIDDSLEADATVTFALENATYEIDLNNQNIDKLRKALEPFIAAARKVPRSVSPSAAKALPRKKNNPDAERDAIRYWASKNGLTVSDKGRIPVAVMQAYLEAHRGGSQPHCGQIIRGQRAKEGRCSTLGGTLAEHRPSAFC